MGVSNIEIVSDKGMVLIAKVMKAGIILFVLEQDVENNV